MIKIKTVNGSTQTEDFINTFYPLDFQNDKCKGCNGNTENACKYQR